MKLMSRIPGIRIAMAAMAMALLPLPALAVLGGAASSIDADQLHMRAAHAVRAQDSFTTHVMTLDSGTEVREFVSTAGGQVFAVSWKGPFMPDLQQLLGPHFGSFTEAASQNRLSLRRAEMNTPGLVVRSTGHMRAFAGFAYLPDQVPQGVSVDELR
jgi:hypothetical protein